MNKVCRFWIAVMGIAVACTPASPPATTSPTADLSLDHLAVETLILPNGLQVVLHPDPAATLAHVHMSYRVGSRDDPFGKTGLALVAEHLMYQGTPTRPKPYLELLESMGINVRGGGVGGETSYDRTTFAVSAPVESLAVLLWLEADRMRHVSAGFTPAHVETQITRVKELYQQQGLSRRDRIHAYLYPNDHPYHHPVRGRGPDLDQISVDDVRHFFARHYAPNRAVLTIAGPFAPQQVKDWVRAYFSPIPVGEPMERLAAIPGPRAPQTVVVNTHSQSQARLTLAWPAPADHQVDALAMEILAAALSEPLTEISAERPGELPLKLEAKAFVEAFDLGGVFVWEAVRNDPWQRGDVSHTQAMILKRMTAIAQKGLTLAQFDKASHRVIQQYLTRLEVIGGSQGRLAHLSRFSERWPFLNSLQSRLVGYQNLSREDIRKTAEHYLRRPPAVIVVDHTLPAQGPPPLAALPQPQTKPALSVNVPAMQTFALANGFAVTHITKATIPRTGLALVMQVRPQTPFLEREKLKLAFYALFAQASRQAPWLGEDLSMEASSLGFIITLRCLPDDVPKSLHVLSGLIADVEMQEADLLAARKNYRTSWSNLNFAADAQRLEWMRRSIAMRDARQLRTPILQQAQAWDQKELKNVLRRQMNPERMTLLVASAELQETEKRDIEKLFGQWTQTAAESVAETTEPPAAVIQWQNDMLAPSATFRQPVSNLSPAHSLLLREVMLTAMLKHDFLQAAQNVRRELFAGQGPESLAWQVAFTTTPSLELLDTMKTTSVQALANSSSLITDDQIATIKVDLLAALRTRLANTDSLLRETAWFYLATGKISDWHKIATAVQQFSRQDLAVLAPKLKLQTPDIVLFGSAPLSGSIRLSIEEPVQEQARGAATRETPPARSRPL